MTEFKIGDEVRIRHSPDDPERSWYWSHNAFARFVGKNAVVTRVHTRKDIIGARIEGDGSTFNYHPSQLGPRTPCVRQVLKNVVIKSGKIGEA
jgi:hypothetical protein